MNRAKRQNAVSGVMQITKFSANNIITIGGNKGKREPKMLVGLLDSLLLRSQLSE